MTTHIGPQGPSKCGATVGKCPYGGPSGLENHFSNHEDAVKYYDSVMAPLLGAGSLKKNQPNPLNEKYGDENPPAVEAISRFMENSKAIPGFKVTYVEDGSVTMAVKRPGSRSFTLTARAEGESLKVTAAVSYDKEDLKWTLKDEGYKLRDIYEYEDDHNVEVEKLSKDEFQVNIKEFTLQHVETGESLAYKLSQTINDLDRNGGSTHLSGKILP